MWLRRSKYLLGILGFSIGVWARAIFAAGPEEYRYVQPVHIPLRSAPQMSAAKVQELARGEKVEVLETQPLWLRVRRGEGSHAVEGWLAKVFLCAHPPIGAATLTQDISSENVKASRRRSSAYTVSAATRGFLSESRVRPNRESNPSDFEALTAMESVKIQPAELDKFRSSARLNPE